MPIFTVYHYYMSENQIKTLYKTLIIHYLASDFWSSYKHIQNTLFWAIIEINIYLKEQGTVIPGVIIIT